MSAAIPPNDSVDPVEYTPEQMSEQLACFETILNDRLPYCSGTLSTTKEQLVLFYGKDFDAKYGSTNPHIIIHNSRRILPLGGLTSAMLLTNSWNILRRRANLLPLV